MGIVSFRSYNFINKYRYSSKTIDEKNINVRKEEYE